MYTVSTRRVCTIYGVLEFGPLRWRALGDYRISSNFWTVYRYKYSQVTVVINIELDYKL